jgi:predicted glycosyltransferase
VRVWIDVDNAPHVQIFRPIIRRLRERGAEVSVTARNRTFVPELLRAAGIEHTVIGHGQPKGFAAKATAIAGRTASLARFGRRGRFDVAVGHGSRSLPPAAKLSGVRNLTMFDYEHVSTWLFRRFCDRIQVPRAVVDTIAGPDRGRRGPWRPFEGFKEEIYLADFTPDGTLRSRLGISETEILAVVRPPSRTAHYHDAASEAILDALARRIAAAPNVRAVWLRRDPSESVPDSARVPNILIPDAPLDGLSLLAAADLAVSGGGTMNREAALLGTPAYSIFTGPVGALDRELIETKRLTAVREPEAVERIPFMKKAAVTPRVYGGELRESVVDQIWDLGSAQARAAADGRKRWAFPS